LNALETKNDEWHNKNSIYIVLNWNHWNVFIAQNKTPASGGVSQSVNANLRSRARDCIADKKTDHQPKALLSLK